MRKVLINSVKFCKEAMQNKDKKKAFNDPLDISDLQDKRKAYFQEM